MKLIAYADGWRPIEVSADTSLANRMALWRKWNTVIDAVPDAVADELAVLYGLATPPGDG